MKLWSIFMFRWFHSRPIIINLTVHTLLYSKICCLDVMDAEPLTCFVSFSKTKALVRLLSRSSSLKSCFKNSYIQRVWLVISQTFGFYERRGEIVSEENHITEPSCHSDVSFIRRNDLLVESWLHLHLRTFHLSSYDINDQLINLWGNRLKTYKPQLCS